MHGKFYHAKDFPPQSIVYSTLDWASSLEKIALREYHYNIALYDTPDGLVQIYLYTEATVRKS